LPKFIEDFNALFMLGIGMVGTYILWRKNKAGTLTEYEKRGWILTRTFLALFVLAVLVFALIFNFGHEEYVTMLPKSITTAIGMGISEELGGYVTITVAVIIITGVLGNICGEAVCKIFKITNPVAKGIALGTSSHAIGTAKAMEMGEIEGAMSSLSIVIAGICTMVGASVFANFI
jgi:putative effector of murein hydrolase